MMLFKSDYNNYFNMGNKFMILRFIVRAVVELQSINFEKKTIRMREKFS